MTSSRSSAPDRHSRGEADLAPGERLLFAALQVWASRPAPGPRQSLGRLLSGKASPRVAALFLAWVQAVEAASLRPIRASCACCKGASSDLQRLVAACGLATVDLELGGRLMEPLVCDAEGVMVLARALNRALAQCGWPLPARLGGPGWTAGPAPSRTLH